MSLNHKKELVEIAKSVCRQLRINSTDAEKLFWEEVRNRRFENKKFYRQYSFFYDLTGIESFFIADFYCHEEKLIIEIDGKVHNYKLKEDEMRTKILNMLGLKVIRFRNEQIIDHLGEVLKKIKVEFAN
jgi:very-short-patch-repair endonuclease